MRTVKMQSAAALNRRRRTEADPCTLNATPKRQPSRAGNGSRNPGYEPINLAKALTATLPQHAASLKCRQAALRRNCRRESREFRPRSPEPASVPAAVEARAFRGRSARQQVRCPPAENRSRKDVRARRLQMAAVRLTSQTQARQLQQKHTNRRPRGSSASHPTSLL